eukprot:83939-Rhodomonas_salina.1
MEWTILAVKWEQARTTDLKSLPWLKMEVDKAPMDWRTTAAAGSKRCTPESSDSLQPKQQQEHPTQVFYATDADNLDTFDTIVRQLEMVGTHHRDLTEDTDSEVPDARPDGEEEWVIAEDVVVTQSRRDSEGVRGVTVDVVVASREMLGAVGVVVVLVLIAEDVKVDWLRLMTSEYNE